MPYARADFATLASASMPSDKRALLTAIERATLPNKSQALAAAPRSAHRSQIAFAAPPVARSATGSIHFVEPMRSASY